MNGPGVQELYFPPKRHPYYIVAPPFKRNGAGVVTLHLLCHLLNKLGYPAFLILRPDFRGAPGYEKRGVHGALATPLLTEQLRLAHFESGLTPVTVYPETTPGNPFRAPFIARFIMYYPGALGGERAYAPGEHLIAFSERIRRSLKRCDGVVSFPVADPDEWASNASGLRTKRYYYAEKYIHTFRGSIPEAVARGAERITHDMPRPKLVEALKAAYCLYAFEDSAVIYEALLAGAAVVLKKNEHFQGLIAEQEMGLAGIAQSDDEQAIRQAAESLGAFPQAYRRWMENGLSQVRAFAQDTQAKAARVPYAEPMRIFPAQRLSSLRDWLFFGSVLPRAAAGTLREEGPGFLLGRIRRFVSRRRGRPA